MLLSTGQYLRHDSLRLFAQPDLSGPLRKPLKIYDLAYIYKFSESGREALLGTADWFAPDSVARQLLGWAPTTALQALGQGWFMEPDTVHSAQADYQLYSSPTQAWQNKPDGQTRVRAFPAVPWASSSPRLPVLKSYNRDGQAVVEQLGLLTPLLDVSNSSILNVNGHRVTSQEAARWRDQARKYNVLYLLEDSPAMRPYWAELVSAIQATTVHLQDSTRRKIYRLGAVTYHKVPGERRASRHPTPLTSDFAAVLDELEDHKFAESPEYNQPIREGFDLAFNLLSNHRGENNLIVLVGISGDIRNITRMNSIYAGLQASEARLLAFQVVAPPDTVANNFVLQAQQLVMQSALAVGKVKRERLASPRLVVPIPVYDLRGRTQNIYHLDFPKRSMVPGWVLFPTKRNKLPISLLLAATDSILAQLSFDAKQTQAALDRAFAVSLPFRSHLNPQINRTLLARREPATAELTPKLFDLRQYPFYRQTYVPLVQADTTLRQLRLLTPDAYAVLGEWLDLLADDKLNPARKRDRNKLTNHFRHLIAQVSPTLSDTAALAQPLSALLGLPVRHPLLAQLRFSDLAQPDIMPPGVWARLLYLLRERRNFYQRLPTFAGSRFTSNGRTYYWLSEDLFR